jgi:hypothetical protein
MTAGRQAEPRGKEGDALHPPLCSRSARRSISSRDFAPGAAILSGQVGFRAVGGPWWVFCLLTALGLAVVCLKIVFPQDSLDKVAWWSERRRTRRRCQCQDVPLVTECDGKKSSSVPVSTASGEITDPSRPNP